MWKVKVLYAPIFICIMLSYIFAVLFAWKMGFHYLGLEFFTQKTIENGNVIKFWARQSYQTIYACNNISISAFTSRHRIFCHTAMFSMINNPLGLGITFFQMKLTLKNELHNFEKKTFRQVLWMGKIRKNIDQKNSVRRYFRNIEIVLPGWWVHA